MSEASKNQKAWIEIFKKYDVLEQVKQCGFFIINSKQINDFREARLMTKFDTRVNLPEIFSKNNLSILPISRGGYIISHFQAYKEFESLTDEITHIDFPGYLESIDPNNITSESTAINCAYISGMLNDFINDPDILPTVSGRMSSREFDFDIDDVISNKLFRINVVNSQIEIDGGYEGSSALALLEAKNSLSDDFLVRQLYYPFRLWSSSVSKPVKSIFMVYSNSIFSLYEYEFEDPNHYNSLRLVKHKNYSFESTEITMEDILAVVDRIEIIREPQVPFPQADKFKRVINMCELLDGRHMSSDDIAEQYAFDKRQSNYYADAGRYLGLIDKRREGQENRHTTSAEGKRVLRMRFKERQLTFVEKILSHKAFYDTFQLTLKNGEVPSWQEVVEIMKSSSLYNVHKPSTFRRRASTIIGWINWILQLTYQ